MTKVAFLGFSEVPDSALKIVAKIVGSTETYKTFDDVKSAAKEFTVRVTKDGKPALDGSDLIIVVSPDRDSDFVRAQKLSRIGVETIKFAEGFVADKTNDEIESWATNSGKWPEPEISEDDLLDSLFDDDDEDGLFDEEPEPSISSTSAPEKALAVEEPEPAIEPEPVRVSAPEEPEFAPIPSVRRIDVDSIAPPSRRDSRALDDDFPDYSDDDLEAPAPIIRRRTEIPAEPVAREPVAEQRRASRPAEPEDYQDDYEKDQVIEAPEPVAQVSFDRPIRRREQPAPEQSRQEQPRIEPRFDRELPSLEDDFPNYEGDHIPPPIAPIRRAMPVQESPVITREPVFAPVEAPAPIRTSREPERNEPTDFISEPSGADFRSGLRASERNQQSEQREMIQHTGQRVASLRAQVGRSSGHLQIVTGANGGVGKTTLAWQMANIRAKLLKDSNSDPSRSVKVWLIESDYSNPKLANRLGLNDPRKSFGYVAKAMEDVANHINSTRVNDFDSEGYLWDVINESAYQTQTGLMVIPAPYDTTGRDLKQLSMTIVSVARILAKRGQIVFVDAPTVSSSDDAVNSAIMNAADRVVLVGNPGDNTTDVKRAASAISKPKQDKGIGVNIKKLYIFMNKTSIKEYEDIVGNLQLAPFQVAGYLEYFPKWQNEWAGKHDQLISQSEWIRARNNIAYFMNQVNSIQELRDWLSIDSSKKPGRGIGGLFRRRNN